MGWHDVEMSWWLGYVPGSAACDGHEGAAIEYPPVFYETSDGGAGDKILATTTTIWAINFDPLGHPKTTYNVNCVHGCAGDQLLPFVHNDLCAEFSEKMDHDYCVSVDMRSSDGWISSWCYVPLSCEHLCSPKVDFFNTVVRRFCQNNRASASACIWGRKHIRTNVRTCFYDGCNYGRISHLASINLLRCVDL